MTEVTYWSDTIGEPRTTAAMVAFNHDRAQILAPHRVVDPWAGLDRTAPGAAESGPAAGPGAADDPGRASEEPPTGW
jgi:hypothetical protein